MKIMKKIVTALSFLLFMGLVSSAQSTDSFITPCIDVAGADAKYLKDFRIELGKSADLEDFRYKANMSFWKNTRYRFSMCTTDDSKGQLILIIKDESDQVVLSSYDKKTGKSYPLVDFTCNRSGIYKLSYDFTNGQQGSALGVVCVVK